MSLSFILSVILYYSSIRNVIIIKGLKNKMGNLIYLTIEGSQQGLISRGCGTLDSIGNKYQEGKEDEIIIIEYSSTITRSQNVSHHPIEFIKNIDKSSPLLLVAISNNEVLKLTFDFYRTSQHGKNEKYYTIVLNQASIVDYSTRYPHSINSNSSQPEESVLVQYRDITCSHHIAGTSGYSIAN